MDLEGLAGTRLIEDGDPLQFALENDRVAAEFLRVEPDSVFEKPEPIGFIREEIIDDVLRFALRFVPAANDVDQ